MTMLLGAKVHSKDGYLVKESGLHKEVEIELRREDDRRGKRKKDTERERRMGEHISTTEAKY